MGCDPLTFVDLFAGAGGLSLGLERAGFNLRHAVEIDEDARETYASNRVGITAEQISSDIREVPRADIHGLVGTPEVDLVAGGPPCQGFSEVGKRNGEDERNHLFEHFVDWVEELAPRVALFENVRGMRSTAGGRFLDAVQAEFQRIGYEVLATEVTSADFGVPQLRRRIVVLAFRGDPPSVRLSDFHLDPVRHPSVMDGIGDLPPVGPGEDATEYKGAPETVLQNDLRGSCEQLSSHQAAKHPARMVEMISHIPDGGNRKAIPDELQPSSGYHNSYSRLQSDEPAVAITSNMSKPSSARCIHPFQHRGLTPREGARLQTFPDDYRFVGGLVSRRVQIGNAVPPYLAEGLGYYLKEHVFRRQLTQRDLNRLRILRAGALPVETDVEQRVSPETTAQQMSLAALD